MKPTRQSQPYRRGSAFRQPGTALSAMQEGKPAFGENPMDLQRRGFRWSRQSKVGPLARLLLEGRR